MHTRTDRKSKHRTHYRPTADELAANVAMREERYEANKRACLGVFPNNLGGWRQQRTKGNWKAHSAFMSQALTRFLANAVGRRPMLAE